MTEDRRARSLGVGMVGLRLHGRGALAGLAYGGSVLRPAVRPGDDRAVRPQRRRRPRPRPAARLGDRRDRLAAAHRARRHPARRRLHAGRHARRDRHRGARGGQARALREAARQHRRRGGGDGRGRRAAAAARASARWWASTTAGSRRSRWPASWSPRAGSARSGTSAAQYLQDWIVDPQFPLVWRLQKDKAGSGALGDIGAHIIDLAQFVTGQLITGVSGLTETFVRERPLPEASAACRASGGSEHRPGHGRRRRAVHRPASPAARSAASRPPGSPPAARTRCASRSTARAAASPSTSRSMNELHFYDGTEDAAHRRVPPHPGHRADAPVRRRVVAARPRPRLRAHVHPRGRRPRARPSATAATRARRSPTGCRCSGCSPPSRPSARRDGRRRWTALITSSQEALHDPTDHAVHRPVGRPAVRGDVPAGLGVGLRRPRDRLLGRPLRGRQGARATTRTSPAGSTCSRSTTSASTRSPTTWSARPCATTRSTSGTAASCRSRLG